MPTINLIFILGGEIVSRQVGCQRTKYKPTQETNRVQVTQEDTIRDRETITGTGSAGKQRTRETRTSK